MSLQLRNPRSANLKHLGSERRILLTLSFDKTTQADTIQIEMDYQAATSLLALLQDAQAQHKIPIPDYFRPSGPPKLRIVEDDE